MSTDDIREKHALFRAQFLPASLIIAAIAPIVIINEMIETIMSLDSLKIRLLLISVTLISVFVLNSFSKVFAGVFINYIVRYI